MTDQKPGADNTLAPGSIVNVHCHDGSCTGGCTYLGVEAFNGSDQAMPQLVLESIDSAGDHIFVLFSEVAWIDTLGTPFTVSKPPQP